MTAALDCPQLHDLRRAVRCVLADALVHPDTCKAFLACADGTDASTQAALGSVYEKFSTVLLRLADGTVDAWCEQHKLAPRLAAIAGARACAQYGDTPAHPEATLRAVMGECGRAEVQRLKEAILEEEAKADELRTVLAKQHNAGEAAERKIRDIISKYAEASRATSI